MPYKDPKDPRRIAQKKAYYERTKEGRYERIKHNLLAYKKRHRLLLNKKTREWQKTEAGRRLYRERLPKHNEWWREQTKKLTEAYLLRQLKKLGHTIEQLKENPEIIQKYREHLRAVRKVREVKQLIDKKNGKNTKTNKSKKRLPLGCACV